MTRPAKLGRPRPVQTIGGILGGSGNGSDGSGDGTPEVPAPSGQVPTSNGSNGVAWGSNVAIISAGGSNVLGPFVNFTAGSNVAISATSNNITISADPRGALYAFMPLSSVASNTLTPELVWDGDNSLIPTLVPV